MNMLLVATVLAAVGPVNWERHEIDAFPAGYQTAVADLNGDGKPDVIALSTDADRVDWYENPTWKRRPVARTDKNIDLAVRDLKRDGHPLIAVASGFYFGDASRGGQISLLERPQGDDGLWTSHPVAVDPVVHRIRWGDLDGDGKPELIHAPIFGPGSHGNQTPKPAHLWAFRPPADLAAGRWEPWKIDETLTVLHGLYVGDWDHAGRDSILTASYEGIYRFDFVGAGDTGHWKKTHLSAGAPPRTNIPGAARGSSEVAPGRFDAQHRYLAAIEPWHGNQVIVYTPGDSEGPWRRHVLDESLNEGHALAVADLDGDGVDEIVAGWRGAGGGLALFQSTDASGEHFVRTVIDPKIPAECVVAADLNGDGRLDLVVSAGRSNTLAWYENLGK